MLFIHMKPCICGRAKEKLNTLLKRRLKYGKYFSFELFLESIFPKVFATTYVFHIHQAERPYLFPHLIPTF